MKVRTITIGIDLVYDDFVAVNGVHPLNIKLEIAKISLDTLKSSLIAAGYEVQTVRVAFNTFEDWLLNGNVDNRKEVDTIVYTEMIKTLVHYVEKNSIDVCSIGYCRSSYAISLVPSLLAISDKLYCSALFKKDEIDDIAASTASVKQAAQTLLDIAKTSGVFGCFRFCASFNCPAGIPFFPAAYYEKQDPTENTIDRSDGFIRDPTKKGFLVSIGLECADLLFIGLHGASSVSEGSRNLSDVMRQALSQVQSIAISACTSLEIEYGGIDASINPGLSLPDSVGAGLENLLFFPPAATSSVLPVPVQQFGEFGTLAAVSAVTAAVKSLAFSGVKLIGYNGLMLPVMEDLILAERAAQVPPSFTMRDLLTFSSVCGVGLDTVPVPGDITVEKIAGVYMETAALAFRLNKPLSCRLLVMNGKVAGDTTDFVHSYLHNTRVFAI